MYGEFILRDATKKGEAQMADENEMSTPADNRELRKIIHTATGYGILTKAEIVLIAKIVDHAIDRELANLEKTMGGQ